MAKWYVTEDGEVKLDVKYPVFLMEEADLIGPPVGDVYSHGAYPLIVEPLRAGEWMRTCMEDSDE
jgi:hypothetical protein